MQDPKRVWLMKRIMCVRQGGIRDVIIPNEGKEVFDRFMREHDHLLPRYQRDYPRIFSFIKAHCLLNCFNREKVSDDTILANEKDIDAGFALYKGIEQSNEMGLSPYILKIYDDAFKPILSVHDGVSREDILRQHYKARHKPMSPEVLRLEIIPQLEAVGLIYQEEGERRKMLVYPTVTHTYNSDIVNAGSTPVVAPVCVSNGRVNDEKTNKIDKIEKNDVYPTVSPTYNDDNNKDFETIANELVDGKGHFTEQEWMTKLMFLPVQDPCHCDQDEALQVLQGLVQAGKVTEFESGKYKPTGS
jgi:hypothetical protein